MRTMLRWELGLEATNNAIRNGTMAELNTWLDAILQPEAAYFGTEGGRRTAYIVFDLDDPSRIPVIAEPLFQKLHSVVEFIPVMNAEDLQKGLAQAAQASQSQDTV